MKKIWHKPFLYPEHTFIGIYGKKQSTVLHFECLRCELWLLHLSPRSIDWLGIILCQVHINMRSFWPIMIEICKKKLQSIIKKKNLSVFSSHIASSTIFLFLGKTLNYPWVFHYFSRDPSSVPEGEKSRQFDHTIAKVYIWLWGLIKAYGESNKTLVLCLKI